MLLWQIVNGSFSIHETDFTPLMLQIFQTKFSKLETDFIYFHQSELAGIKSEKDFHSDKPFKQLSQKKAKKAYFAHWTQEM